MLKAALLRTSTTPSTPAGPVRSCNAHAPAPPVHCTVPVRPRAFYLGDVHAKILLRHHRAAAFALLAGQWAGSTGCQHMQHKAHPCRRCRGRCSIDRALLLLVCYSKVT